MTTTDSTSSTSSTTSTSSIDYLSYLGNLTSTPFNPNTVINALLAVDQIPITNLQNQIKTIQSDATTYKNIAADLSALAGAEFSLTLQGVSQAKTATSSNANAVTATASPLAQAGTYSVVVNSVATSTVAKSTAGAGTSLDALAGTTALSDLNLSATAKAGTVSIIVDGSIQTFNVDTSKTLTDPQGGALTQLQAAINAGLSGDAAASATVTMTNDKVAISFVNGNTSHTISFGASGDTSNFLSVMGLGTANGTLAASGGAALSLGSSGAVGVAQTGVPMWSATNSNAAALATALTATSGSFSLNGTSITWDATKDSVNDVVGRINNSNAGVTAQYDSINDKLMLSNKATGQSALTLTDIAGGFLSAMNLAPGTTTAQVLGGNASITVNNTTTVVSASNSITTAVPGLTITAAALTTAGSPATITVGPDTAGITKSVQTFVDALNKVLTDVAATQAKDDITGTYGDLLGDTTLTGLSRNLQKMVLGRLTSSGIYQSLQDIGITTGDVGSTVGTTTSIKFDTTKFAAALTSSPDQVASLFNGSKASNGFDGIARLLDTYLDAENNPVTGAFALEKTATDSNVNRLNDQITQMQRRITSRQAMLVAQFSAMSTSLSNLAAEQSILTNSSSSSSSSSS